MVLLVVQGKFPLSYFTLDASIFSIRNFVFIFFNTYIFLFSPLLSLSISLYLSLSLSCSCGKSSLMVALFHIEPLASGRILIDGIDISTVPLRTLRSKLCIIPQDPVMFSATVRFNLDPFDEFTDEQVWDVLRSVSMFDHVQSLPNKLMEMVAEGGDNFSAGQRQVITNYCEISFSFHFLSYLNFFYVSQIQLIACLHRPCNSSQAQDSCHG